MTFDVRKLRLAFVATLILAMTGAFSAAFAQAPIQDKEYKLITPAHAPQGKKIEVVEFFSYACPHCAEFEAPLRAWLKNKPDDVEFKTVPLVFRENWKPLAKLYHTLDVMGFAEKLHSKVFQAIHGTEKLDLTDPDKILEWVGKQGIDKEKFKQTYNSFGMDAKVEASTKMGRDHGVMFTPAITINGKYLTGPSMAMGPDNHPSLQRLFQVVDALIAQERPKTAAASAKKK